MGGTRLTSSAIQFTQADWIRHYGPAWEPFRAAKQRYDPKNVLTPGHSMFPGWARERGVYQVVRDGRRKAARLNSLRAAPG